MCEIRNKSALACGWLWVCFGGKRRGQKYQNTFNCASDTWWQYNIKMAFNLWDVLFLITYIFNWMFCLEQKKTSHGNNKALVQKGIKSRIEKFRVDAKRICYDHYRKECLWYILYHKFTTNKTIFLSRKLCLMLLCNIRI